MTDTPELSRDKLALLVHASKALLEVSDIKSLAPKLLDMAFEVSGVERGFMLLRDDRGELKPSAQRGIQPGSLPDGDPSKTVIDAAIKARKPIISRNAIRDPRFSGSESIIIRGIRSACCIPLVTRGDLVGALYLDTQAAGRLTEDEAPLLEAFGSLAALAVGRALELHGARKALENASVPARYPGIIGDSAVMRRVYNLMERLAGADLPALITGESGTGKELIARALHETGPRKAKPFRALFCGNINPELLESELFGYKKGAFTGAITDKQGLLDVTDGGTLFLDEIADVPGTVQAKLLRFLQDGEFMRLGDPHERRVDVRILSATNRNLKDEISAGRFREDLFYRLNVLAIESPPLRERDGDIPVLAAYILAKVSVRTGQSPRRISVAALDKLISYAWPGNVRELENILSRAAVLSISENIEPEDIDLQLPSSEESPVFDDDLLLKSVVEAHLKKVLKMVEGNRSEAARKLGVSRRYLQKSLAKWREEGDDGF